MLHTTRTEAPLLPLQRATPCCIDPSCCLSPYHRLDCDDDTADCDAENPKHHKKEVEEIEVDVPEGWSPEHRGDIVKVKTPKFNPVPVDVPKVNRVRGGERGRGAQS